MKIDHELMLETYNNCVDNTDSKQDCFSCEWYLFDKDSEPCCNCYNELLGSPANPTKWKAKEV